MIDSSPYLSFALVSLTIAASPGPSWVYTISTTINQGQKQGLAANAGNSAGILIHALASTIGLAALLSYSAIAFNTLKLIGVGYLIYLGYCAFTGRGTFRLETEKSKRTYKQIFRDGALVNILNPKMSLLFLALLPQFVSPETTNPEIQIAIMGMMHAIIAFVVHTHVVYFSNFASSYLKGTAGVSYFFRYLTGSLFIAFGLRLAFVERS